MAEYGGALGRTARIVLTRTEHAVPKRLYPVRVAVAFLVLRPFDAWPSFWNRYLGSKLISRRSGYPGGRF